MSHDGRLKLTLDLTGSQAKVAIDGSNEVIGLTRWRVPKAGTEGYALLTEDGVRILEIDDKSGLVLVRGGERLELIRYADTAQLGAPTTTGIASPRGAAALEETIPERERDALAAVSVRVRFPWFESADGARPSVVAEALARATPDMFVHTLADTAYPVPVPTSDLVALAVDAEPVGGPPTSDELTSPLARYNAFVRPIFEWGPDMRVKATSLAVHSVAPRRLSPRTPALVWEVDGPDVVLVTLDGARYWTTSTRDGEPTLGRGLPPRAEWGEPPPSAALEREAVARLAALGGLDRSVAADLDAAWAGWSRCARKVVEPASAEVARSDRAALFAGLAERSPVTARYSARAKRRCGDLRRVENLLAAVLSAREKERLEIYSKTLSRLDRAGFLRR